MKKIVVKDIKKYEEDINKLPATGWYDDDVTKSPYIVKKLKIDYEIVGKGLFNITEFSKKIEKMKREFGEEYHSTIEDFFTIVHTNLGLNAIKFNINGNQYFIDYH